MKEKDETIAKLLNLHVPYDKISIRLRDDAVEMIFEYKNDILKTQITPINKVEMKEIRKGKSYLHIEDITGFRFIEFIG